MQAAQKLMVEKGLTVSQRDRFQTSGLLEEQRPFKGRVELLWPCWKRVADMLEPFRAVARRGGTPQANLEMAVRNFVLDRLAPLFAGLFAERAAWPSGALCPHKTGPHLSIGGCQLHRG
jgi:hypothetical protein